MCINIIYHSHLKYQFHSISLVALFSIESEKNASESPDTTVPVPKTLIVSIGDAFDYLVQFLFAVSTSEASDGGEWM